MLAVLKANTTLLAFIFGLCFVTALLVLAIWFPNPTAFQYTVFRITLALAAAGIAGVIPGMIRLKMQPGAMLMIHAGGALAVFVIVYLLEPAKLPTEQPALSSLPPIKKEKPAILNAIKIGQYIDNRDGTITDTGTDLMWKRCSEGLSGLNCEEGKLEKYKWVDAVQHSKNVDYAGYSDWRLPTVDELKTLVYCSSGVSDKDDDRCNNGSERPTINQQAFPNTLSNWYWSGSPYASSSDYAWGVDFNYGYSSANYCDNFYAVRLVRSGQ